MVGQPTKEDTVKTGIRGGQHDKHGMPSQTWPGHAKNTAEVDRMYTPAPDNNSEFRCLEHPGMGHLRSHPRRMSRRLEQAHAIPRTHRFPHHSALGARLERWIRLLERDCPQTDAGPLGA